MSHLKPLHRFPALRLASLSGLLCDALHCCPASHAMPAKKKSSSKSSSSKSSWVGSSFSEEPIVPQSSGQRTLTLDVRGVTWHFLNLSLRVPASTTVFELTALIGKRHGGSVTDLVLYKDEVNARNLLSEPMKTLDAIFHVPSDASSAAAAVIFYDFAAFESDCPLLLLSLIHI